MSQSSLPVGKTKEASEQEQFALYKAVLEGLPDGLIFANDQDEVVFVNKTAEIIRQISRKKILNRSVILCHSEGSREKVKRALQFLRKPEGATFKRMVRDTVKDKYYENTYGAVRDDTGAYLGALIMSRDVTDRRKLEEERALHFQALKDEVDRLTVQAQELFVSSMASLANALEAKDPYTAGHSIRVSELAAQIAEHRFGVSPEVNEVRTAGKLHDIGKVGIHEQVLNKPGPLTEGELKHIREHPVIAENILEPFKKLISAAIIIRHHHERYDGKGYPDGLAGEDIPELSRILALADSYDAMTSARPYRPAINPENAAGEIKKNLGTQFDPKLGRIFMDLFLSGSIG
ncbi:MAG: HD domain-containing phosphohydrolase [Candidatus Omnitrophota bacterium]